MIKSRFLLILLMSFIWQSIAIADSRDDFLTVLGKVSPGMPKVEVDRLFKKYMKGTNWPYASGPSAELIGTRRGTFEVDTSKKDQLTLKNCDVYRHSNDGKYDSDWGIVCFKDGKVDWVDFAPD
ncbi:MAG: hypothetical protein J0M12_17115 [Deltaproteobacteria bacterium]|nr:hypothetical protein [Deltaproteobacteria bacterium]